MIFPINVNPLFEKVIKMVFLLLYHKFQKNAMFFTKKYRFFSCFT